MRFIYFRLPIFASLLLAFGCAPQYNADLASVPEAVDFNFHVKPILSDRCFKCHGPDAATREAGLRLDLPENAIDTRLESGGYAIVPGSLRRSKLFHRITTSDPEERMPPAESNLMLDDHEVAILARWIEQGAEYKPHWALLPVEAPAPPVVKNESWIRNPIDRFVLEQLESRGLSPESEADRETLLRRVTLDLTGLPPTIEDIDAFMADENPQAYEKVVDRLLQTDAHAERLALEWLDVARYADSHGYSLDGYRSMWPWRDWVIDAFQRNLSYSDFLTWQLAGDLLPEATQEQRLATAFLRNQRLNSEGGIVPAEYMMEYAVDRTVTTSTAFMGLTMECARCHDHKYDPISQREFYEMYAFFNSVNEVGEIRGDGNDGPQVLLSDPATDARIDSLSKEIAAVEARMAMLAIEFSPGTDAHPEVDLQSGLISNLDFDLENNGRPVDRADRVRHHPLGENAELVSGRNGLALKFTPYGGHAYPDDFGEFDRADPFSFSFWVQPHPTTAYMNVLMKSPGKNDSMRGYEIALQNKRLAVHLINTFPSDRIEVQTRAELPAAEWSHATVTYNGTGKADGIQIYINGRNAEVEVAIDALTQSIVTQSKKRPLRIGWRRQYQEEVDDGFGLIDDLRVYDRVLTGLEAALLHDPEASSHDTGLRNEHILLRQDSGYAELQSDLRHLYVTRNALQDSLEGVMVMADLAESRPTYILERGVYDAPTERVYPSAPASILPFPEDLPDNRFGLAQWLVDEDHPLTSRVAVNRYWQMIFGRGIVETTEDFGSQGSLPSHPALLDWLASSFVDTGWNVRALLKMMVTSAAYRQASKTSPKKRNADPDNVWLARGPSHRLSAEMLRDQALAASGLLVRKTGGPSVKPYQPPGLWAEKSEFTILKQYVPDDGPDRYRRGMYTFWRRTSPPPAMIVFDAPTRDNCIVRRQRTSTPLQALVLLNDPQFVEAARVMAERLLASGSGEPSAQITLGYRLLTGRRPGDDTLNLLTRLFEESRTDFERSPDEALALVSAGIAPRNTALNLADHAAMTLVCNMMMSLEESVIRK